MQRVIYVDNAATTTLSKMAWSAMKAYSENFYGNPSSLYSIGREARRELEGARKAVATCLNADPKEIYFTSGGSESDNWAIKGCAAYGKKVGKKHIVTTYLEHHAVLHSCRAMELLGCDITYVGVGKNGIVNPSDIEKSLRPDTVLVSVMFANNEIGTVQPVAEIAEICRSHNVLFHTDAVQAVGVLPVDVQALKVDFLSCSAHKFHGPKGTGVLYQRKGLEDIPSLIDGGAQENGRRAGTENIAGAIGLAVALKESCDRMEQNCKSVAAMRDALFAGVSRIEGASFNGDMVNRLPGNLSVNFPGVPSESLLESLDIDGICASSGSACNSASILPSHVLRAIGLPEELARCTIRLTVGTQNTMEEMEQVIFVLSKSVRQIRRMGGNAERGENRLLFTYPA